MSTTIPLQLPDIYTSLLFLKSNWYLFLAAYLASRAIYDVFFHPLAKYPGPWLAKVSDVWKAKTMGQKRYKDTLVALHKKHGDVVRIGPNEVSLNLPGHVKEIYGAKSPYLKGPMYDAMAAGGDNLFTYRDPAFHASGRRSIASAYTPTNIALIEPDCSIYVNAFCALFDKVVEKGETIDIAEYLEWYAYDCVAGMSFGETYGFLDGNKEFRHILPILHEATWIIGLPSMMNNIGWLFSTDVFRRTTEKLAGDRGPMVFAATANRFVRQREALREQNREQYESRKDMLYRFLEAKRPNGDRFTHEDVVRECQTIVLAGADSNRSSMMSFVRHIYDNPTALAKVRAEIDDAVARNEFDSPPTHAQLAKLEYFQASLKEAIRLFSAVGMTLQRVVPEGGRVLGGQAFPAGSFVGMNPWVIHYDERAYGKDAGKFRPERWLEGNRSDLEQYYLSFGGGTRICIGKHLAFIIMEKLCAQLVAAYDIEFVNRTAGGDPHFTADANAVMQHDFFVRVKRRAV